jgi:hypothetical protein
MNAVPPPLPATPPPLPRQAKAVPPPLPAARNEWPPKMHPAKACIAGFGVIMYYSPFLFAMTCFVALVVFIALGLLSLIF